MSLFKRQISVTHSHAATFVPKFVATQVNPIEYEKLEEQSQKLDDMSSWALNAEIEVTPTFFVNRHQLPKSYHISDLKYIL